MLTGVEVLALGPRYRRFRAELRVATRIDESDFRAWRSANSEALVQKFTRTVGLPVGLIDEWIMEEYAREMEFLL